LHLFFISIFFWIFTQNPAARENQKKYTIFLYFQVYIKILLEDKKMLGYNKWKKLNENLDGMGGMMGMVRSPNIVGKLMGRVSEIGDDPIDADDQGGIEFSQVDMDNGEDGESEDVEQICIKHPKYGVVCGERVSGDDYEDDDYEDDDSGEMGEHDDNIEELGEEEEEGPDGDYVEIEDETPMESVKHMKNSKKKCWGKMSKSKSKMNKSKMDDGSDDMDDDDMEDTGSAGANMKKKMKSGQEKKKGCYSKKSCGSDKMESRADYLGLPSMNEWVQSIKSMLNPNERYDGMNIITEKASKEEHEENEHEKNEEKALKKGQQAIKRNDMDHQKILAKLKDLYSKLPKSLQKQHKKQCDM
jgi:hypothetical protein